ncbi:MAG: cupin-like domain-containing protein [Woeseiaceae bacterium]
MSNIEQQVREIKGCEPGCLPEEALDSDQPLLLRDLVASWPLVEAAKKSADAADTYLRQFYNGMPVTESIGPPEIKGRIFYDDDLSDFNFRMQRTQLDTFLDNLRQYRDDEEPPVHYVGSTTVDYILPGFRADNDLVIVDATPLVSIWLGNQTRIAAHYDVPDNIACVVAGTRRFTLFPPNQLENLYVGPLDYAPAGQAISMVDFHEPDFEKYPKFRTALRHAQVADMRPGDALFIPSMWWHHVEGLDSFNILINYWWRTVPAWMGNPMDVLNHALLSIRDLPAAQRAAWQNIFAHYIFEADNELTSHIPEARHGVLSPIDELSARRLRALLLKQLNR